MKNKMEKSEEKMKEKKSPPAWNGIMIVVLILLMLSFAIMIAGIILMNVWRAFG